MQRYITNHDVEKKIFAEKIFFFLVKFFFKFFLVGDGAAMGEKKKILVGSVLRELKTY